MQQSESIGGVLDALQHDDTQRRRLRLRLSAGALEVLRSFAGARGVSQAGLIDALFHGLPTVERRWLDAVIEQARRTDSHFRSEDAQTSTNDPLGR